MSPDTTQTAWKVDILLRGDWRGATCCLLSRDSQKVLVDTGSSHEDSLLVETLARRGLRPEDVTTIVCTHFHLDHVMNNSLFSRSRIHATQESYEWAFSLYSDLLNESTWEQLILKYYPETLEYEHARENMSKLRRLGLRWWDNERLGDPAQYRWLEKEPLPGGLQILKTPGHVPGHISIIVESADSPTIIAGDALLTRNQDDSILTMIPQNQAQARRDHARLLSLHGTIIPGHDQPFPNCPDIAANGAPSS